MNSKKTIPFLLLMLALAASTVFAQGPAGPHNPAAHIQRQVQRMTTLLSLTPTQQTQATTILTNAMNGGQSIHSEMKAAHQALKTAIANNDQAGISSAATTIGNLTAQMITNQGKAHAALRQMLTADQQSKLSELESEGEGTLGFGGPGGHFRHQ